MFLNSKIRYSEIEDGSSKTILLSEKLVSPDELGWVSGTRADASQYGLEAEFRPRPDAVPDAPKEQPTNSLAVGGFSSRHPGGINAAFGDGSIHFVSDDTDPELLQQLGNRADGQIMKPF